MSSYLLLRNNKESGPFTMDEVKSMSLKSYDLIWVVGKSAAWRYPGEIPELRSFAPSVPNEETDFFRKIAHSESKGSDPSTTQIPDLSNSQPSTTTGQRSAINRSVYINLPADKNQGNELSELMMEQSAMVATDTPKSDYELSAIYKRQPSAAVRYSGKILWVSTIILLFGAGIMTGLFISDRRKFFSSDENHPQNNPGVQEVVYKDKKENAAGTNILNPSDNNNETNALKPDSVKKTNGFTKKQTSGSVKKLPVINAVNNDSVAAEQALLAAFRVRDSLKQDAARKSELLYQAIAANPEKYFNLSTGRYSTGIFGGISSFPVTITNHSPVKIALIEVTVDYIQNNNKVYKSETLSFNDVEPGETLTMKAPKSARGTKIASQIHIVNVRQTDTGSSN